MMKTHPILLLALLTACRPDPEKDPEDTTPANLDVTERLGEGEVRAGVVEDGAALFGGVSAEGALGDVKLYNDRVQVIIQGVRESSYYEVYGGGLVDADVVRPEGQPGRDVIDELSPMMGLGRLVSPESVTVIADGSDGEAAIVRVVGRGGPMELLTGALEAPDFVKDLDVEVVTDFTLRPGAWLVEVETELTWLDTDTTLQVGDLAMVGVEVTDGVLPGRGLEGGDRDGTGEWLAVIGKSNEVALAIFSDEAPYTQGSIETLLQEVGPVLAALEAPVTLEDGDTHTWRRSIGVGPDLATITGAWRAARGEATTAVGGVVTADGAPVAGARVHLLDGEDLETIAFTDEQGAWTAEVTASAPSAVATGRGHGNIMDLPSGAGWVAPYAHEVAAEGVLDSLDQGALPVPFAEGYGVSASVAASADTALELTPPGFLDVSIADGGPGLVRVDFATADPAAAGARVPGRPSGAAAYGYVRDGDLRLPLEPGEYRVTVHRGLRYEPVTAEIVVTSGESVPVDAALSLVVAPEGVLALDPHSHASPSGDGQIAMSHRLLTMASNGVQVHFGTDHDHVADYRPMLAPLGLEAWLHSVVADEVSPVLRGHTNVYPLTIDASAPNNGAPRWWTGIESTDSFYTQILAFAGSDAILQLNHPWGSSGMLDNANYDVETGTVGKPDFFSEQFTAMEVLNDGQYDEFLPLYLDLVGRGYTPTPVGVSDAHGYRNGVGENLTWLDVGLDEPGDLTDAALKEAMHAERTVVSRGPYIDARVDGDWAPGQTFPGGVELTVEVVAASFVVPDVVELLRDGVVVESRDWTGATESFTLDPEDDAYYVVIVSGDTDMSPVYPGQRPWAMTAAMRIDADGGGWEHPLPSLQIGN